jgi:transposase
VARYKSTARDLGAYVCFEDEAGQGLRPPKGRTWARRGARPVVRVRGAGGGRVSIAGVVCFRPGGRPHLFFKLPACRRRRGEPKGFSWADYRDLIIVTHRQLAAPLVWVWDNLNIHLAPELADFAKENEAWLRICRLPAYAPDLNPAEGIWSLLKRSIANFAAADVDGLVRIIKRKLKKIQYRPHLIENSTWVKHAKGRILLDLHTVSARSPHGLQTVGMMLTATSKSLSLSEVCYGTGFRFPWLNTILGVLYGTQLGGRRRRRRSAACRPRGDRSHPQSRHLTSRWTRSAPDRTGSPGAGGAAGGPGRAGLGGGPGWPFWPPLRWRWPLSCWLQPVGMPGTW